MARASRPAMLLAMAMVAAAELAAAQSVQTPARRPVVAVLDFTNSAIVDHQDYEPFTVGIPAMLLTDLRRNERIELVERERIRQVLSELDLNRTEYVNPETAARVGRLLGAHHIIVGVFVIDRRGDLRLDARAINVETSRIEHVETVSDDADNLLRAVSRLGQQLSEGLELPLDSRQGQEVEAAKRGQVLANLKYARALLEEDRSNALLAVQLYREFLSESPPGYATQLRQEAEARIRILTGTQDPGGR